MKIEHVNGNCYKVTTEDGKYVNALFFVRESENEIPSMIAELEAGQE